jgi:NADH-quinone oxidoreductase subunit C
MTPSIQEISDWFSRRFPGDPVPQETSAGTDGNAGPEAPFVARPGNSVRTTDFQARGYHLEASVLPGQVVPAAAFLDQLGFALDTITGVDWIAENEMEVVYDYFHPTGTLRVAVRTWVPRGCPEVPTISEVYPGANWHERETHEFFGIRFLGHPNLTPLLLPEDAEYHPLRKDFVA